MKVKYFEDLIMWQKAKELSLMIYGAFKEHRDYSFRDQIQRASISIMNNIAEGFERGGDKEFKYFLYISKGSCGEVRSMLHVAKDLRIISDQFFSTAESMSKEISYMTNAFIGKLSPSHS